MMKKSAHMPAIWLGRERRGEEGGERGQASSSKERETQIKMLVGACSEKKGERMDRKIEEINGRMERKGKEEGKGKTVWRKKREEKKYREGCGVEGRRGGGQQRERRSAAANHKR